MSESPRAKGRRVPKRRGAPVVERVLAITLGELARVGWHRLSVPEIAAQAGLNKTSVYRRWPTKAQLVGAALSQAMGHDAPLPDTGSLRADMEAFALAAAAWADSPTGRAVTRTLLVDGETPAVLALVRRLRRNRASGPVAIFRRAIARGELAADADVPMALSAIAGGLTHRVLVEDASPTPAFVRRLVALVLDGLARRR